MEQSLRIKYAHETVICYGTLRYVVTLSYYVTSLHYVIALRYYVTLLRYVAFDSPIYPPTHPPADGHRTASPEMKYAITVSCAIEMRNERFYAQFKHKYNIVPTHLTCA